MGTSDGRARRRIRVEGIVQGVGFRPFVYALAVRHRLAGLVGNDTHGVFIEVEGDPAAIARFTTGLVEEAPPLATVERVTSTGIPPTAGDGFAVVPSTPGGRPATLIAPDTATCADCLRELFDPADRRYRHPFVNCTNCGPRFTIVRNVPYDRATTTMAGFPMCGDCTREYHDPADRRFHAQPLCCPACGPTLRLDGGGSRTADPIAAAAALLRAGAIVAVKGLGGYHLAADAASDAAASALRGRKHREDKAFAVMVPDEAAARRLCVVSGPEARVLASAARPIVLLRRNPQAPRGGDTASVRGSARVAEPPRGGGTMAPAVAPGSRFLGLMLPYTALHHLLLAEFAGPLVLTSGNVSDEPIAHDDGDARERLAGIADAFLWHDRPIHVRVDDSVVRVFGGATLPVRRSRGYAPMPLRLTPPAPRPVLGCGAELKSTFCLARDGHAFVSHHIGDLENYATLRSYTDGIVHLGRLFDTTPEVVAHDLHPQYLSTRYALGLSDVDLVGVQHHHAHIASCLADNGRAGPVIGVAFDGLGYGTDGTMWGGEFLVADLAGFTRAGHFAPVPMPGAAAAIRQPWRMAASHLDTAYGGDPPSGLDVLRRNGSRWHQVVAVARAGVNSPPTSSAGRLFDAVAALVGVRDEVTYEGQAAVELEQAADPRDGGSYRAALLRGYPFVVSGADLVRAVVDDLRGGVPVGAVAMRFHRAMAAVVVDGAARVREATGLGTVALSGGVFQNLVLLGLAVDGLRARGFEVLTHHRVPPNDAGISLGQVAVAARSAGQ